MLDEVGRYAVSSVLLLSILGLERTVPPYTVCMSESCMYARNLVVSVSVSVSRGAQPTCDAQLSS